MVGICHVTLASDQMHLMHLMSEIREEIKSALESQRKGEYLLITPQLLHLFSFSFSILFFPLLLEISTSLERVPDLLFSFSGE